MKRKTKKNAPKKTTKQVANVPLKLKSRFVQFIKMDAKPRGFAIVQIEGTDYVEFNDLKGVFFKRDMFV